MTTIARPSLAPDAAIVLGIAATAMPFARTRKAEAERWLRILRLHGKAGGALCALGVTEAPLTARDHDERGRGPTLDAGDRDPIAAVTETAVALADQRSADAVATTDVLAAVMRVYGPEFDRVLHAHGTDRDEVQERLSRD